MACIQCLQSARLQSERPQLVQHQIRSHQHQANVQDAPRDASATYLATLPTTQAVLTALQRACAAKHRILANQPPLRVETLWLHDEPPSHGYEQSYQLCNWVACSPSGHYLAVTVEDNGTELPSGSEDSSDAAQIRGNDGPATITVNEVHVYSLSAGFEQLASFCTDHLRPCLQWSPGDLLCFAQSSCLMWPEAWAYGAASPKHFKPSAAFVWDPCTSSVILSLCDEAAAGLCSLLPGCRTCSQWSPSGQYLLVHGARQGAHYHEEVDGWLMITDLMSGTVVVQSTYTALHRCGYSGCSIMWHPALKVSYSLLGFRCMIWTTLPRQALPQVFCLHGA